MLAYPPHNPPTLPCSAAQALLRHVMGRQWRRQLGGEPLAQAAPAVAALLAWFWDRPGLDAHPFSIHSLCEAGRTHGCRPLTCS